MTSFLSIERKRLGLTQAEVYEKIDVGKSTYLRWEGGKPIPSDKLAEIEKLGFDLLYVVTGRRKQLEAVEDPELIPLNDAIEAAKYAAREAIKSVYQVKKLRNEVSKPAEFDVLKNLDLIEKAAEVLAESEITGQLNTDTLFTALKPSKKQGER
ncbi:helix-turn-helix domain-containing protein [Pseudoalteromonas luteoviolacea]|uniref:helix-turn-helix domain-containing protein n=1 Tax=Pseudoalteromonas luteoviolacea TaxID=43657 RepID=UPI00114FF3C3|nr:helix-turn-helix transcriptional regulator [Pseudoalteromonas luteoviolacea]TQF69571.1 helix-turn-helix transcriptional regulator [Pseudoalteromonas luteoviolacea]